MTASVSPVPGRVLILDDDPTGTQCAADIEVFLRSDSVSIREFLQSDLRSAFVVTNTRALEASQAARLVSRIARQCHHYGGAPVTLVLRGDSTLRGHVRVEMEALGLSRGAGLLVPAFPAAGRQTIGGVHYADVGGEPRNVADTEFARDPVFGFNARTMRDWVVDVLGRRPVALVSLDELRGSRGGAVAGALREVADGGIVIPDIGNDDDIGLAAVGYGAALAAGRAVVLRTAAPLAAAVAGTPGRMLSCRGLPAGRIVVVCGSHTRAATAQLDQLSARTAEPIVMRTSALFGPGREEHLRFVAGRARAQLEERSITIVATERTRQAEHGGQAAGAVVMAGLVEVTRQLAPAANAVIAKGGITSADIASQALRGRRARVVGQIETGVPLWQVRGPRNRSIPVAVVPGNIGDAGTLVRVAEFLGLG